MEKNNANQKKDEIPRIPLGIIMRELKTATKAQIDDALKIQTQERESTKSAETPNGKSRLIGKILVEDFGIQQKNVDDAFKIQVERQDLQKRVEAKLVESGAASKDQIKEVHDNQLKAIKADEIPKDFKKLLEDSGVQPDAIKQAEAAAQKDIAIERQQKALEEGMGKSPEAPARIEKVEPAPR